MSAEGESIEKALQQFVDYYEQNATKIEKVCPIFILRVWQRWNRFKAHSVGYEKCSGNIRQG